MSTDGEVDGESMSESGSSEGDGGVQATAQRSSRNGSLKRALYIRTNHRGPSILVTENVPILIISPPNVPTLVMFEKEM